MRIVALGLVVLAFAIPACAPATTYNRGIEVSFHPSSQADGSERLVSSAIQLRSEADTAAVKDLGGQYLGELEVIGERAGAMYMGKSGGGTLAGRISLEAANRGATHFYLAASRVENGMETTYVGNGRSTNTPTSKTHARFVLFRVERTLWPTLPSAFQPEGTPAVQVASASAI